MPNEKAALSPKAKKHYAEPVLRVYGDIRVVTQSVNSKTTNNDTTKGFKTH